MLHKAVQERSWEGGVGWLVSTRGGSQQAGTKLRTADEAPKSEVRRPGPQAVQVPAPQ